MRCRAPPPHRLRGAVGLVRGRDRSGAATGFGRRNLDEHIPKSGALTTRMERGVNPADLVRLGRYKSFYVLGEYREFGGLVERRPLGGGL